DSCCLLSRYRRCPSLPKSPSSLSLRPSPSPRYTRPNRGVAGPHQIVLGYLKLCWSEYSVTPGRWLILLFQRVSRKKILTPIPGQKQATRPQRRPREYSVPREAS